MGDKSKIEWTATRDADGNVVSQGATWNVVTGCSRVSEGCRHCYAERLAATRLRHVPAYEGLAEMTPGGPLWTGKVRFNLDRLDTPLRWRRPRMIFVNSQSDLFHEGLTNEQIAAVFGVMAACPQHVFQVLTKRPARMLAWFEWVDRVALANAEAIRGGGIDYLRARILAMAFADSAAGGKAGTYTIPASAQTWPLANVWLGVSAEDQATADARIPLLLQCPAAVRWVSAEPLLGPIDLARWAMSAEARKSRIDAAYWKFTRQANAKPPIMADPEAYGPGLDWVVVGGESGPGARPMHLDWARGIRDQSQGAGVPFFFKQHGEYAEVDGARCQGSEGASRTDRGDGVVWLRADGQVYELDSKVGRLFCSVWGADVLVKRVGKRAAGRLLDGRTWDQMPAVCHA